MPPQPSPEKLNIKKHSFGKSTPPPKPKPPSFTHKGSSGSLNGSKENIVKAEPSSTNNGTNQNGSEKSSGAKKSEDLDLDMVLRSDDKLAHLTAERVKAPKRRPPSSGFQKEAVSFLFFFFFVKTLKFFNSDSVIRIQNLRVFQNGFFLHGFLKILFWHGFFFVIF